MATKKTATKKAATKKAATKKSPVVATPLWSSEGGWEQVVPGGRLRERSRPSDPKRLHKLDLLAFGEPPPTDPAEAIRALAARVDRANAKEIPKRDLDIAVASAWGERVCAALGWVPAELRDRAGRMVRDAVVSPDRRYFVRLRAYARRVLKLDPATHDNTVALLFDMLRDGSRLPPAEPGSYLELG